MALSGQPAAYVEYQGQRYGWDTERVTLIFISDSNWPSATERFIKAMPLFGGKPELITHWESFFFKILEQLNIIAFKVFLYVVIFGLTVIRKARLFVSALYQTNSNFVNMLIIFLNFN